MKLAVNRLVTLLLTVVLVVSAMMTGTYGWQSMNQQAQNEKIGEARTFAAELHKLEKLPDGTLTETPVPNAVFYLFTADGEQIGGRYVTNSEGKIAVQLPRGDYYFEEADPGPSHTFDRDEQGQRKTRYPFTVAGGDSAEATVVTAYNLPLEGPLTIRKTVQNADGSPLTEEQEQEAFEFTVTFSDGGTYGYRIDGGELQSVTSGGKIYLKHGETAVFENIPVGVLYNVTETPKPGYLTGSSGHRGNITEEGCAALFVNTYAPEKTGSLTVSKEVTGSGANLNQEFAFTAVIDGQEISFTLKHGESHTFPDLPIGTEYTVTETEYTEDGYIAGVKTYTGTITGEEELLLPFVNFYHPDTEQPGNLEITKEVVGENADPDKEFTFEVTFSDGGTYSYRIDGGEPQSIASGGTITLKAGQAAVFESLPHGVTYTVRETDPAGYLPAVDSADGMIAGGETAAVPFQNRVPEETEENGKLTVTKQLDGEYPETDQDKEFHFTLIVDGEETEFTLKPGESMEFDLPAGAEYEIREDDYFDEGYSQSIVNGEGTVTVGLIEAAVTNTFAGTVMVEIPGEKTWDLQGYPESVKPDSILVRLMDGGRVVEEKTVAPDESGEWRYTFDAPKYDEAGKEIQYTVEEVPLYNFIPSYDGYNIKNTYLPPVSIDPPVLQKAVDGDPGAPRTRFEFLFKGSSGAPMPEGSDGNTKILTLDGSGEVEIGEITFDRAGTYVYTITELNGGVQGWTYDDTTVYTLTVTVTVEDGRLVPYSVLTKDGKSASNLVFTNTYEHIVPPDETIVSGTKTWNHGDNPNPPDSIIVYVYADGGLYAQRQVTAQDDWAFVFELPKYAEDGHEIRYTIGEAPVQDYETEVKGYDLVNTYAPGTNPGAPGNPDGPQTGDNTNIWPWIAAMAFSLLGIAVTTVSRRKYRRRMKHLR